MSLNNNEPPHDKFITYLLLGAMLFVFLTVGIGALISQYIETQALVEINKQQCTKTSGKPHVRPE